MIGAGIFTCRAPPEARLLADGGFANSLVTPQIQSSCYDHCIVAIRYRLLLLSFESNPFTAIAAGRK